MRSVRRRFGGAPVLARAAHIEQSPTPIGILVAYQNGRSARLGRLVAALAHQKRRTVVSASGGSVLVALE
jgi:hypothetical protein